jgi:hypothetical protein
VSNLDFLHLRYHPIGYKYLLLHSGQPSHGGDRKTLFLYIDLRLYHILISAAAASYSVFLL